MPQPTKEQFIEAIEGVTPDGYQIVQDEVFDSGRWEEYRQVILYSDEENEFYAATYAMGLTEYQHTEDDYGIEIEGEVRPRAKIVVEYVPKENK